MIILFSYPLGADGVVLAWLGLTSWAAVALLSGILVLAIARLQRAPAVNLATQLLATAPWFLALTLILVRVFPGAVLIYETLTLLAAVVVFIVTLRAHAGMSLATFAFLMITLAGVLTIDWYRFIPPQVFYGHATFASATRDASAEIDIEQVFHDQPRLLEGRLADLLPQRPGESDLYFLGFAGAADEEVFRRDTAHVRQLLDQRYDTAGRSLNLAATHDTLETEPLANIHNLQAALAHLGRMIDPNEDTVFLYLASHGSRTGALQVSLNPLPLAELTAQDLRAMLDAAGIGWRIIVISACYSGAFVEALATDQSIVLTAASAQAASFGCEQESDMTWFADALFSQGLGEDLGLLEAFTRARAIIAEREAAEEFPSSQPQIFVGESMRRRMDDIKTAVELIER